MSAYTPIHFHLAIAARWVRKHPEVDTLTALIAAKRCGRWLPRDGDVLASPASRYLYREDASGNKYRLSTGARII